MNTMPVAYLDTIHLEFVDGRVWQLDIKDQLKEESTDAIADRLLETLSEYKDEIKKIDFKVDIERLKKDILDSTKSIL
jgi:hypothetical protein